VWTTSSNGGYDKESPASLREQREPAGQARQHHALIGPNGAGRPRFNLLTSSCSRAPAASRSTAATSPRLPPTDIARLASCARFNLAVSASYAAREWCVSPCNATRRFIRFLNSKRVLSATTNAAGAAGDVGRAAFAELTAVELPYGRKRALELAPPSRRSRELLLDERRRHGHETSPHRPP